MKMKKLNPLKKLDEDVVKTGVIQADTVAQCGTCIAGTFAHTVTAVDVYSAWIENREIWTKKAT